MGRDALPRVRNGNDTGATAHPPSAGDGRAGARPSSLPRPPSGRSDGRRVTRDAFAVRPPGRAMSERGRPARLLVDVPPALGGASSPSEPFQAPVRLARSARPTRGLVDEVLRTANSSLVSGAPARARPPHLVTFHFSLFSAPAVIQRAPPGYPLYDTPCPPSASGRPARRTRRTKDRDRTWAFRGGAESRRGARRRGPARRCGAVSRLPREAVSAMVAPAAAKRGASPATARRTTHLHPQRQPFRGNLDHFCSERWLRGVHAPCAPLC